MPGKLFRPICLSNILRLSINGYLIMRIVRQREVLAFLTLYLYAFFIAKPCGLSHKFSYRHSIKIAVQ